MTQSIMSKYFQQNENAENNLPATAGAVPEVDMGAVATAQANVSQVEMELNLLETTAGALDNIAAFVSGTISDGGMDRGTAAAIEVGVKSHLAPLGLDAKLPATESFGGGTDKLTATNFALEGIKEESAKIYKAIRDAIVRAYAAVKKWFAELFNKVPGLIKKFEAIKAKADKTTGTIENNKISISAAVAAKLHIGKKVDESKFGKGLEAYAALTAQLNTTGAAAIANSIDGVVKAVDGLDVENQEDVNKAIEAVAAAANKPYISVPGNGTVDDSDYRLASKEQRADADFGFDVSVSEELLGGLGIFTLSLKDSKAYGKLTEEGGVMGDALTAIKLLAKGSQKLQSYSHKETEVAEQDIATINASAISDFAQQAIDVLENIKKNVDNVSKIAKSKDAGLKVSDQLAKDIGGTDKLKAEERTSVKALQAALKNNLTNADAVVNKITGTTVAMVNALGSVLSASLAEHK